MMESDECVEVKERVMCCEVGCVVDVVGDVGDGGVCGRWMWWVRGG